MKDDNRLDVRNPPDPDRRTAFMHGWTDAVKANGGLYNTVLETKTHQNMGNLFGWIYGDQSPEFREETWNRYVGILA